MSFSPFSSRTNPWRRLAGVLVAVALSATVWGFTFILNDDTGLPIKWPAGATTVGAVPIVIMLGNTQTLSDGTNFNSSVQAAIDEWNSRIGAVQFQATQQTKGTATDHNGKNELAFASKTYGNKDFGDTTLAVTLGYSISNERTESDTLFKDSITWDSYRGPTHANNVIDIRRVALHELGHTLGLDHPDEASPSQSVSAIMNSHISGLDDLTDDDIQGAQSLYGPPGVPGNNSFANATTVTLATGKLTLKGYNTNATKEAGEPAPVPKSAGGRSVWWRWTPPSDGSVTIDTKGSYYDTTLAIFTGSALSSLATVAVSDDIQDGVIQASTVTFNVTANTTYQIAVDGFNGGDATGADTGGITLNFNFIATVGTPPTITTQPTNATATVGGSASFSVTASGSAPLSYQWSFNNSPISGATSATYSISSATTSQAGNYFVTVSNAAGSVSSASVLLTVNAAPTPPPSSGGGGGGGGGAPSLWFVAALSALGFGRLLQRRCR